MTVIEKCEALVLQIVPYSRTSHLVTWLSAEHGFFVTIVKGACRPRGAFLGQYDLFYTCELLFYAKSRGGVYIAKECMPLNPRTPLRICWRAAIAASHICDVATRLTLGTQHAPLYELVNSSLDALCTSRPGLELLMWFELRLTQLLGLSPQLWTCVACNRAAEGRKNALFSVARGGILCSSCLMGDTSAILTLSPDVLRILRRWAEAKSPQTATTTICSQQQLLAITRLLGVFYEYHLGKTPESRRITLGLLGPEYQLDERRSQCGSWR